MIVSAEQTDGGYFIIGWAFCISFILSAYVSRFWTEFDNLDHTEKLLSWIAPFIGVIFTCMLTISLFASKVNEEILIRSMSMYQ